MRERGYELIPPNGSDRFPIETLGVELGLWHGRYQNLELPWLCWWDRKGNLLLTGEERADREGQRANLAEADRDREKERADRAEEIAREEREENQQLRDRLLQLGVDPDRLS